eukprot:TRINITY_DN6535_c0_g1_i1.p1 TRINITY_DN6535_c0_g1~~TRINITY_DN6535_c0_g1_i1.p1  ORF type:complete len:406 (-),score=97.91 TRINITY_DN6535_c0_g1_i1:55-1149(-)
MKNKKIFSKSFESKYKYSSQVELYDGKLVVLDYNDLIRGKDLSKSIEKAYNYDGLGILAVKNVPNLPTYRKEFLPYASRVALLTKEQQSTLENKESKYCLGWSHGKEKFEGVFDVNKGSYYFNPQYDVPSDDKDLIERYPESFCPNLWPTNYLPGFEGAAKQLGRLMVNVGILVAEQCDLYTKSKVPEFPRYTLRDSITRSYTAKARLLHYFSFKEAQNIKEGAWCGWHNDHGSLTALCPAMFMHEGNIEEEISNEDPNAGLWIKSRKNETIKVNLPRDYLGFQIGETSQIQSGGFLRATPHSVMPSKFPNVVRNTLAVFMQPNFSTSIDPPAGIPIGQIDCKRYKTGMNFGDFHKVTLDEYYD